eukprot:7732600-Alexandrium_andersonii.AAC.1
MLGVVAGSVTSHRVHVFLATTCELRLRLTCPWCVRSLLQGLNSTLSALLCHCSFVSVRLCVSM